MSTASYLVITQLPTSLAGNSFINVTSTTILSTSDWSNNGSGRYTYTGTVPRRFTAHLDWSLEDFRTGGGGGWPPGGEFIKIIKNITTVPISTINPTASYRGKFMICERSNTFTVSPNDFLQIYWDANARTPSPANTKALRLTFLNTDIIFPGINSYIYISQSIPATLYSNILLPVSNTSTTNYITSEWTNNGSGVYTYTGLVPKNFTIQIDVISTITGSATNADLYVFKTSLAVSLTNVDNLEDSVIFFSLTDLKTESSKPFTMIPNDSIGLYIFANGTVTSSIKLSVTNTSY